WVGTPLPPNLSAPTIPKMGITTRLCSATLAAKNSARLYAAAFFSLYDSNLAPCHQLGLQLSKIDTIRSTHPRCSGFMSTDRKHVTVVRSLFAARCGQN